jgi:hypothetical protein
MWSEVRRVCSKALWGFVAILPTIVGALQTGCCPKLADLSSAAPSPAAAPAYARRRLLLVS